MGALAIARGKDEEEAILSFWRELMVTEPQLVVRNKNEDIKAVEIELGVSGALILLNGEY